MTQIQHGVALNVTTHNEHTVLTAAWKGLGDCSRSRRHASGVKSPRELQPRTVVTRKLENVVARPAAGLASCPSEAINEHRPSDRSPLPASGQAANWGASLQSWASIARPSMSVRLLHQLAPSFFSKRHDEPDYSGAM
jgi:hypothetical protein